MTAVVTAYTWTGSVCADGHWPCLGECAAPRWVPLHTRVLIGGHEYLVTDRMNRRYPDRWDIYQSTRRTALEFGIQKLTVNIPQLP